VYNNIYEATLVLQQCDAIGSIHMYIYRHNIIYCNVFNRSITPTYRIIYYGIIAYACRSVMTLNKFYARKQNIYRFISNLRSTVLIFFLTHPPSKCQCLVNQWRLMRTKYGLHAVWLTSITRPETRSSDEDTSPGTVGVYFI